MTSKLEHALALARDGYYVFPCEENGKLPIVPWRERSTRNPKTIRDWYVCPIMEWPQDYNIGIDCGKSGILVVDVDCKNNQPGKENYEQLDKEKGFGKDRHTVITPSGGLHLYYRNSDFGNTTSKLAVGIDTRGVGGYVLAPGSEINGKVYAAMQPLGSTDALQSIEPWLSEALHSSKKQNSENRKTGETYTEDNPDDIAAAIEFLQNHEPAIEKSHGDRNTFVTFCMLKERGISLQTAIDLADEYWNPNCSPPWDLSDLTRKAESAYRSAHNATGAKSPHAEFDIPKEDYGKKPQENKLEEPKETLQKRQFNEGFLLPDALSFPARNWVYGKLALAKNVTLIIAPPGVGKSTLTLGIALSKASGKDIFGIDTLGKGTVAIFNNEDNLEEQARRLVAASIFNEITNGDISDAIDGSRLLLNGRDNAPLTIAKRDKSGAIVAHQAKELTEYLMKNDVKLLIVDPFAMTHPADENKNEEMLTVGNLYAEVANRANCAVILVHHTRKLSQSSSEGHNGNLDSARGASSLGGVVRVAYTLNVMSKADAKRHGIEEDQRLRYLLLEQAKANMSAPGEHQMYFERIGVPVGQDNESVGVLKPVTLTASVTRNESVIDLIKAIEEVCPGRTLTIPNTAIAIVQLAEFQDKQPDAIEKRIRKLMGSGELTGIKYLIELKDDTTKGRKAKVITTQLLGNNVIELSSANQ